MTTFSVRVSAAAAQRFDAIALHAGGRSVLLRRLIDSAAAIDAVVSDVGRSPRPARVMVRLSAEDAVGAETEARAMGLRLSTWIAALIRHRVSGRPRFSPADETALLAIHGEIHRIGINANQIARALNTAVLEGKVLDLEIAYLDGLRTELRAHLGDLRAAFEGNLAYWQVDP